MLGRKLLLAAWVFSAYSAFAGEAVTYYHNDAVGSPATATDQAGYVRWRAAYRPYGDRDQTSAEQLASSDNRKWFTGHVQDDATGLTYAGARYYAPVLGRFLSVDPVGFEAMNEHSFGRYIYANNNPYKFTDPDGKAIVIVGSEAFKANVQALLDVLRLKPNGAALVRSVEGPERLTVRIIESVGANNSEPDSLYAASDFRGSGGELWFNPNSTTSCCDEDGNRERPAFVGLAHELGHFKEFLSGTAPRIDAPVERRPGTTPPAERGALVEENKVRIEHNLSVRPSYFPVVQKAG
jgi:RHS repeat-associated protein